jgi:hypothetical protein
MIRLRIGVDPGASGALAFTLDGTFLRVDKRPDTPHGLLRLVRDVIAQVGVEPHEVLVCQELVGAMPGDGRASIATFLRGVGWLEMLWAATNLRCELVTPATWQADIGAQRRPKPTVSDADVAAAKRGDKEAAKRVRSAKGKAKTEHKNNLKKLAQRMFPSVRVTLDTADALLLVEYAARTYRSADA